MKTQHPPAWILALVRDLAEDPVISLERRDPPTHALVRAVYVGCGDEAIVEIDLIDSPPPPTAPIYGGFFEALAFDQPSQAPERPWFVFERSLSLKDNVARFTAAARDHVLYTGRRESPPICVDEVPDPVESPRPSFEDMGRTQRRPSQPPPSRPPSSKAPPAPLRAGSQPGPSSQRSPQGQSAPASHRAPPRRRPGPPEPPPPAPPIPPQPPAAFRAPPPAAGRPPPRPSSIPPPPPPLRPAPGPLAPPPPMPRIPNADGSGAPSSGPVSGLPPPPPPPPPPPFGEDEI